MKTILSIPFLRLFQGISLGTILLFCFKGNAVFGQVGVTKDSQKLAVGVIDKIDQESKTFSIKYSNGKEMGFVVDDKTVIEKYESPTAFSHIKVGSSIKVLYVDEADKSHFKALALRPDGDIPPPPPIIYPPRTNPPSIGIKP